MGHVAVRVGHLQLERVESLIIPRRGVETVQQHARRLGHTLDQQRINCLTARAEIRFRRPALVGEPLVVTGTMTRKRKRLIEARSTITLKDGTIVAEGKSLMYIVGNEK